MAKEPSMSSSNAGSSESHGGVSAWSSKPDAALSGDEDENDSLGSGSEAGSFIKGGNGLDVQDYFG